MRPLAHGKTTTDPVLRTRSDAARRRHGRWWLTAATALLLGSSALAQQSANFRMEERVFNAGGHPGQGGALTSASFRVTFGSLGDPLAAGWLSSESFGLAGGFVAGYLPPTEVTGLRFTDRDTAKWDRGPVAVRYNMYRGLTGQLVGREFGVCHLQDLETPVADVPDPAPSGAAYFYLITAKNTLNEEGTRGFQSDGAERTGSECP